MKSKRIPFYFRSEGRVWARSLAEARGIVARKLSTGNLWITFWDESVYNRDAYYTLSLKRVSKNNSVGTKKPLTKTGRKSRLAGDS